MTAPRRVAFAVVVLVALGVPAAVGDRDVAETTVVTAAPSGTSPLVRPISAARPEPSGPGVVRPSHTAPDREVPASAEALRPVRVSAPAIGIDATVVDLGIAEDGTIDVPSNPDEAGWLHTTAEPGQLGPAVIAGHVDSESGPAVFYRLASLRRGDELTVTRRDGSVAVFNVDGVRRYAKSRFPTAAVYGPVPVPALRLITCGGEFDYERGHYEDNVVVFAS